MKIENKSEYVIYIRDLKPFEFKAILSISSVNTLCLSLLNLCCVFNIDSLFFMNCLWFFLRPSMLHDKTKYVIYIRNLKQPINHGSVLKDVQKVIKFNQNAWLKLYIDMNTDLR